LANAVVLMGVSGSGKTTVGRLLAQRLGWTFLDADDFHPPANVEKMRRGEPLVDADRGPWLQALADDLRVRLDRGESAVLACSALKQSYRNRLRVDERVRFVVLRADPDVLRRRLADRPGHYFAPSLLASQLETLELPRDALILDASGSPNVLVHEIETALGLDPTSENPT
jgi:carbohydrate kinase (thermoresistant glucokinase family)